MGLADKLIAKIEQQAETLIEYRQTNDQLRTRICVLEGALLEAKAERDKALADVQHWRQARQDAHEAGELMRAEIERLRQQLAEQQAETVDVRRQRNNETDRLNATNVVSVQQRDEIAYLRTRLDEERSVSAGLRQQLDAALALLTRERLDAETTEPTPVAEPLDAEGGA